MRPTPTLLAAVLLGLAPAVAAAQAPSSSAKAQPPATAHGAATAETPLQRPDALKMLSSGSRWAEVEGKLQPDGSFIADDVEIIAAADAANMKEMELTGVTTGVDPAKSSLKLLGYTVKWNDQTKITDEQKQKVQASSLQNGKDLKATGQVQADGTFLARKLRLREATMKDGQVRHKEKITGPVQVVDAGKGTLRILKTTVQLEPNCEFVSLPVEVQESQRSQSASR
jgi:uncharacterized protein DUF5666